MDDAKTATAVRAAIECGYRHADTAQAYGNEAGVGEGLCAAGVDRIDRYQSGHFIAQNRSN